MRHAHLERVDTVTAAHTVLHPALVIEARVISGELLRGDLEERDEFHDVLQVNECKDIVGFFG